MFTEQKLDLLPGAVYSFAGIKGVNGWMWNPGLYRLLCAARDVHTYQERVVYQSLGGKDAGKCFVCGFEDWSRQFTRVQVDALTPATPPEPSAAPVEKTAGAISTGESV